MAQLSEFHVAGAVQDWYELMPTQSHGLIIQSHQDWPLLSTKRQMEAWVNREVKHAEVLADSLIAKDITLWEWEFFMIERIRVTHILAGLIGGLGLEFWTKATKTLVSAHIVFQISRLRGFGAAIQKGKLTEKGMIARAMLYPLSGNLGYERIRRQTAQSNGATSERRLMAKKEGCPDCLSAAEQGWVRIGSLPEIGASRCIVRCLCRFDFK